MEIQEEGVLNLKSLHQGLFPTKCDPKLLDVWCVTFECSLNLKKKLQSFSYIFRHGCKLLVAIHNAQFSMTCKIRWVKARNMSAFSAFLLLAVKIRNIKGYLALLCIFWSAPVNIHNKASKFTLTCNLRKLTSCVCYG